MAMREVGDSTGILGLTLLLGCSGGLAPALAERPVPSSSPAVPSPAVPSPAVPSPPPPPSPAPAAPLDVTDHLLPWTDERQALTSVYLAAHRTTQLVGDPAIDTQMTPQVVVLHWTAGPTAGSSWNTFAPAILAGRPELQRAGRLNVSAHYLVDRDGTIQRLMPETTIARHCIGLNHVAIGVENVGGGSEWPLTAAQVEANAALIRDIASRQPIRWLFGHLESAAIEAMPLYEERDPAYRNAKPDPGADFMVKVRAKVADLRLEGPLD